MERKQTIIRPTCILKGGSGMPLKIVKLEQLTKPTRQKQSVVTSLPEFIEATLKLSHGLKPQEGIEITLPKKDERGYKHIAFGMKKHLRAYLDRLGLSSQYSVSAFTHGQNHIIQITHETQPTPKRSTR